MSDDQGMMARRRHELLLDVEQAAAAAVIEFGLSKEVAAHVGAAMADLLLERWAGQQITFPINGYFRLSGRELAIAARRAQGARIFELAREHGMTERGVRKLLARLDAGRAIAARFDQGASIFELAREFGMTERRVQKVLTRIGAGCAKISKQAHDQLDMFGGDARR